MLVSLKNENYLVTNVISSWTSKGVSYLVLQDPTSNKTTYTEVNSPDLVIYEPEQLSRFIEEYQEENEDRDVWVSVIEETQAQLENYQEQLLENDDEVYNEETGEWEERDPDEEYEQPSVFDDSYYLEDVVERVLNEIPNLLNDLELTPLHHNKMMEFLENSLALDYIVRSFHKKESGQIEYEEGSCF